MNTEFVMLGCDHNILSCRVLEELLRAGRRPRAMMLSARKKPTQNRSLTRRLAKKVRDYGLGYSLRAAAEFIFHKVHFDSHSTADVASRASIPLELVPRINSDQTVARLRDLKPDILLVAGFDQILSEAVIKLAHHGIVNLHPSLLPAYRGPDPVFWVLARHEPSTGVTAHMIDEGIDTGDILRTATIPIERPITKLALEERLALEAGKMALLVLDDLDSGRLRSIPQDNEQASYFPKPYKANRKKWL